MKEYQAEIVYRRDGKEFKFVLKCPQNNESLFAMQSIVSDDMKGIVTADIYRGKGRSYNDQVWMFTSIKKL